MGDFNAEPGAPELAALQKDGCALRDAAVAVPLTFHGYGLGCEPQQKIDYLFTSPELRVLACRAWTDEENGVYLSDHYPLCAELPCKADTARRYARRAAFCAKNVKMRKTLAVNGKMV